MIFAVALLLVLIDIMAAWLVKHAFSLNDLGAYIAGTIILLCVAAVNYITYVLFFV